MDKQKEINSKLIGFIIKQERSKKNISASKLALGIKKSRQYISDIEKGVKSVSHATITEIFDFLNIKFEYRECTEAQDLFHKFIDYFYLRDIPNAINRLAAIITNSSYKYSYEYPLIVLSEFIFQELTHQKNMIPEELIDFLDDEKKCIFLYFKAISYFNQKKYMDTLYILKDAKKYMIFSIKFQGLIYSAKALAYDKISDYLRSLEFNKLALKEFSKDHNIERSLTSSFQIANTYSRLGRLNDAIDLYYEIIDDAKRFHITRIIDLINCNLAMTYLYNYQFLEAIKIAENHVNSGKHKEDYYFILTWAYYELHKREKSKFYLDKLMECEQLEPFLQHAIILLSLRLQNDLRNDVYETYLSQIIEQVLHNELLPDKIFIIKHAIKFYESIENYMQAFEYANLLNSLLEKRI